MSKENLKNNGITLIALIITIIVMLILTGVTLSITLGDNGLVNKAKEAAEETQVAMDRELLLSAVIGAMGNDGKVNLSSIVLPEGFIGSNGTYTSKSGNTFTVSENGEIGYTGSGNIGDNIIENGGAIAAVDLNGRYYNTGAIGYDKYYYEIENHNKMKLISYDDSSDVYETNEANIILTINEENKNGELYWVDDEFTQNICYELIIENNKVVNKFLFLGDVWLCQNSNGIDFPLDGMYISEDGKSTFEFDAESGYANYYHNYSGLGANYARINGVYYFSEYGEELTVSDDLNTVEYNGITFTKQSE